MRKAGVYLKTILLAGIFWLSGTGIGGSIHVMAAEDAGRAEVRVEIISPDRIESAPIYEEDVVVAVTNLSDTAQTNLNCFLTVVDEERKQSFPMDEFGPDSYQTRTIDYLRPGETVTVCIPLRVMYVGNFQLVANVVDYISNKVYAASSLQIRMISNTNLHKELVIIVSVVMPLLLTSVALALEKKRGKKKRIFLSPV